MKSLKFLFLLIVAVFPLKMHAADQPPNIVVILSRSCSIVRAAITPGIAQAKLDKSGIKARPFRPTLAISVSTRKAARAM